MFVKEIKEKYKLYPIFINGCQLYWNDQSVDDRKVKNIQIKNWLFNLKTVMIEI